VSLVSPNELLQAAKDIQLEGREPEEKTDWVQIVAFMAYNVDLKLAPVAVPVIAKLFDMPLTDEEVRRTIEITLERR